MSVAALHIIVKNWKQPHVNPQVGTAKPIVVYLSNETILCNKVDENIDACNEKCESQNHYSV